MHRNRKKRNIVIFSLVGILFLMVAGYAAFSTNLEIKGTSKVTSSWDIEITNVNEASKTGQAENVNIYYDKLTASMEADLYDVGDSMEYDVTIENKGTLDAKLNDILTNIEKENNEAVLITFSGYTKGEILKANESKQVHVKIEYNPEYTGGETSSEVEINFDYVQNNNETNPIESQYLITYDYSTNGGTNADIKEEYYGSGNEVNLENIAYKEGYTFVGWNTDKDAEVGLESLQVKENTTLYAIYSKTLKVTYEKGENLKVTYEKGENIESIGKAEDSCNIYNNETSCEIILPEIKVNDESATVGWYKDNENIGKPNDKYIINNDITLTAKAEFKPVIQSWSTSSTTDFHAAEYRTNIITATFVDNKDVPENAVASWDVSANKNGSVMAWVIADEQDPTKYHLYIGGTDGVIANENSGYLFNDFANLRQIIFGDNFDTSNVTSMKYMFGSCSNLTELDINNFNTNNVTDMMGMFSHCSSITILNLSNFDTSKVNTMNGMFSGCNNLVSLDLSNFNTSNVTNMSFMFNSCTNLETLNISSFDTSNVIKMNYMFYYCKSLTELDVSSFDTSNVTNMSCMFYNCDNLVILDVSNFDTSNVTNMYRMFSSFNKKSKLKTIEGIQNFNTSNVTNMNEMFDGCNSLTALDVSNWDTGNVTEMYNMFSECSSLTKLVLCNWNTSKITNMNGIFINTSNLQAIYVGPNWTTENATTTSMFSGSGVSEVIQSNNCEYDAEEMNLEISTTSTTNSITVVANATADSGIAKYEYSKDGGNSWTSSSYNTYTFNGLTKNTSYNIKVRATSTNGKQMEQSTTVYTKNITTPTFRETETSSGKNVTIIYPSGCGSSLTCTYQKDNGSIVNVTSGTVDIEFTDSGSLVANVSDGTNNVSISYTLIVGPSTNIGKQPVELVESGDGLYEDIYEEGRYVYRGQNPNNYIMFNDELWRIIAKETDGTYKIIRNDVLEKRAFDEANHRSTVNNSYCTNPSYGCGVYAAVDGTFSSPSGSQSGTVTEDSSIKIYLNDDYYTNNINSTAKGQMTSHSFNIGAVESLNNSGAAADSIEKNIAGEKMHTWTGNVGLANVSDILRASTNPLCTSATNNVSESGTSNCDSNYLFEIPDMTGYWTINAYSNESGGYSILAWLAVRVSGLVCLDSYSAFRDDYSTAGTFAPRPVVFLKSDTTLNGSGTLEDPFTIV